MESAKAPMKPSWQRWPPNCCETCVGWQKKEQYTGTCTDPISLDSGTTTDSRYRCPSFVRKAGV